MPKIKQFSLATTHRPNPAAVQSLEIPAIKFQVQRRPVMPSLQDRVAQWLLSDDKEMDASPPRPKPSSEKMLMAWRRMVLHSIRIYVDILMQSAADYLVSRNQGTIVTNVPLTAQQEGQQGRDQGASRNWATIASLNGLKRMAVRAIGLCAQRRPVAPARVEKTTFGGLALDAAAVGRDWSGRWINRRTPRVELGHRPTRQSHLKRLQTSSSVAYPARLPPPRSRPDLKALLIQDPGALSCVSPANPLPMEEMVDKSPMTAADLMTQGPITPNKTKLAADQLLEQQVLKAARAETHVLNSSEEEESPLAITDFAMGNQP